MNKKIVNKNGLNMKVMWVFCASLVLLVVSNAVSAAGDATSGQQKSTVCVGCHGVNGEGVEANTKIAGLSVGKFSAAMQAYKSGERNHAMMQMFAKKLNDQDIQDLAAYYATK